MWDEDWPSARDYMVRCFPMLVDLESGEDLSFLLSSSLFNGAMHCVNCVDHLAVFGGGTLIVNSIANPFLYMYVNGIFTYDC